MLTKKYDGYYDVIIIGAGIGGLVSSVFLAKEGFKVLVIESQAKPGGYCISFKRAGFTFGIVQAIGGCQENGWMNKVLIELGMENELKFVRSDPVSKVITRDCTFLIEKDFSKTVETLKLEFPESKHQLDVFFKMVSTNFMEQIDVLLNKSFQDILDELFTDVRLKGILSLLLIETGLSAPEISAVSSFMHYREFVMNGGYYPVGGMQEIPNVLVKKLKDFGGELMLSNKVTKILVSNGKVEGVILEDGVKIKARYVVSNIAARQTFYDLIGEEHLDRGLIDFLESMKISSSCFLVFLGAKINLKLMLKDPCTTYYFPCTSMDNLEMGIKNGPVFKKQVFDKQGYFLMFFPSLKDPSLAPPGCESIVLTILTPFINKEFWEDNKAKLIDVLVSRAEQVIPGLSNHIIVKDAASPLTLYKYTLNTYGSSSGWLQTVTHAKNRLESETSIENLYLAGHWTQIRIGGSMSGISMAAASGYFAAKLIMRKQNESYSVRR